MTTQKVAVIASASGNGKTTVGRAIAARLDVPFVELDALVHGPNWAETSDEDLRRRLEPLLASEGWVVDGTYFHKLGHLVVDAADVVVWLDMPARVWLPRLVRRSLARRGRELWNGNRETLRTSFLGRESLVVWAIRSHIRRRRAWPGELAHLPVVRLRTPHDVERFVSSFASAR